MEREREREREEDRYFPYLLCVDDFPVNDLRVDGQENPEVHVDRGLADLQHLAEVGKERGPSVGEVVDEHQGEKLGRLVPNKTLLLLSGHSLKRNQHIQ